MGDQKETAIAKTEKGEVVKKKEPTPFDTFRATMQEMQGQFAAALPKHIKVERLIRLCLTTVQRTPKLLDCTRNSLLGSLMSCAQMGLEPDGLLGQAYLIPFWNSRANGGRGAHECQLVVGYKGLRKLAFQSGEVSSIAARVVHEKDDFEYSFGLDEKLVHVPSDDPEPGPVTHAYAIFRLKDGGHHFDVMSIRELLRIRDGSQGYKRNPDSSPWSEKGRGGNDFEEMCKKTVFRRTSKMAPASIEERIAPALAFEDRVDAGLPQLHDVGMFSLPEPEPEADPITGETAPIDGNAEPGPMPGGDNPQQGRRMQLGQRKDQKASGGSGSGQQPLPNAATTPAATPSPAASAGPPADDQPDPLTEKELAEMEAAKAKEKSK